MPPASLDALPINCTQDLNYTFDETKCRSLMNNAPPSTATNVATHVLQVRASTAIHSTLPSSTDAPAPPGSAVSFPTTTVNVSATATAGDLTARDAQSSTQYDTWSPGLSTGVKVGIGVTVGGVLVIALFLGHLISRRLQQNRRHEKGRSLTTFDKAGSSEEGTAMEPTEGYEMETRGNGDSSTEMGEERTLVEAPGEVPVVERKQR
ncbi:hypothetical protein P280DRAFT_515546 [Massarina eburnea CBS 473.64]|uniref:Mid2 domain-containing protein n=1 Tax=Massarina eburnea CBS 473.64 TaxID=1395130 RepID=A0A6A6S660_9PLEO|nr:hypothetical protein P280DRAFT_515546 [Massarina eburnea CBS 473.64]